MQLNVLDDLAEAMKALDGKKKLHCNRRIGARERRQLIPHVRFQVPFLGPESQLKSGFACAGLPCSKLYMLVA